MEKNRFNKFYRVFKNDTKITEVSFNDFSLVKRRAKVVNSDQFPSLSLPPESEMFYGYDLKTQAMEKAKAGALKYIAGLIAEGPGSTDKLYQYRFDHFEDLNINLKDSAIRLILNNVN